MSTDDRSYDLLPGTPPHTPIKSWTRGVPVEEQALASHTHDAGNHVQMTVSPAAASSLP